MKPKLNEKQVGLSKLRRKQVASGVRAFNRWMDDYINHPEKFEAEHQSIMRHLEEKKKGKQPTYGEQCMALLIHYSK